MTLLVYLQILLDMRQFTQVFNSIIARMLHDFLQVSNFEWSFQLCRNFPSDLSKISLNIKLVAPGFLGMDLGMEQGIGEQRLKTHIAPKISGIRFRRPFEVTKRH